MKANSEVNYVLSDCEIRQVLSQYLKRNYNVDVAPSEISVYDGDNTGDFATLENVYATFKKVDTVDVKNTSGVTFKTID